MSTNDYTDVEWESAEDPDIDSTPGVFQRRWARPTIDMLTKDGMAVRVEFYTDRDEDSATARYGSSAEAVALAFAPGGHEHQFLQDTGWTVARVVPYIAYTYENLLSFEEQVAHLRERAELEGEELPFDAALKGEIDAGFLHAPLLGGPAAVEADGRAADLVARRRAEEERRACNLVDGGEFPAGLFD